MRRAKTSKIQGDYAKISAEFFAGEAGFDAWEHELAQAADQVHKLRLAYMESLKPQFFRLLGHFMTLPELSLEYRRGWKADGNLLESLQEGRQRDLERGFTQAGPHRANLELKVGASPAAEVLSRGQQKLVVSALKLAQGVCLAEESGNKGVFLVDDLPAELDIEHRAILCRLLDQTGCQVFITSVDADVIEGAWAGFESPGPWLNKSDVQRFHVEQGEYTCLKK